MLMDTESPSFKEKLLANELEKNISIFSTPPHQIPMEINSTFDNEATQQKPQYGHNYSTPIIMEDKQRIYFPWRHSAIIKLQEKRIPHDVLKKKLMELWKPTESFPLIDLGEDYYIVRFNKEENMINSIQKGL